MFNSSQLTSNNFYSTVPNTQPKVTTTPTGVIRTTGGQTTLDKLIAASLQSLALLKGAAYIPTEEVPQQQQQQWQQQYNPYQNPYQQIPVDGGTGATFGASVESFLKNNTALIAIGVVAFVLYQSGRK